jgi:hypothetical protein
MSKDEQMRTDDDELFDPSKRELCSDGMCVGVIGDDGRCKVCGKPGSGDPKPRDGAATTAAAEHAGEASSDAAPPDDWRPAAVPSGGSTEEKEAPAAGGRTDGERVPCPDGMCIGVIGKNGKCGTCGKPADWKEPKG